MNPNNEPTTVCPECARRFIVDPNKGDIQDCPVCGNRFDIRDVDL